MDSIAIYTENVINKKAEITTLENEDLTSYIVDNNRDTIWQSENVITADLDIDFLLKDSYGDDTTAIINTLILQNINLKSFEIIATLPDYSTESIYSITDNTEEDLIVLLGSNTAEFIALTLVVKECINTSDLAQIGQFRACSILNFEKCFLTEIKIKRDTKENSYRVDEGALVIARDYNKWAVTLKIENLIKFDLENIKDFILNKDFFTIVVWQDFNIKDIYEVVCGRNFSETTNRYTELSELSLKLQAR